ncbi:MAG: leucine-rich repeat domain-containing protein, partial [Lewinellaceae bacterium]|nr:leucine-rich repeat domain-containing protein [Lewinellaceae bacterium]
SPVSELQNLELLYCDNTQIIDLAPLAKLKKLQSLSCFATKIADLAPIANLSKLNILHCARTQVVDLSPIASLTNLANLNIGETQVKDLGPVTKLLNLTDLLCFNTHVSDLEALSNLHKLEELHCDGTHITDLSPIAHLTNLHALSCFNTLLTDLSPIKLLIQKGIPVKWQDFEEYISSQSRQKSFILLKGTPLIIPPVEFAQEGNQAILEFFDQLGDDRTPLNELKIIFLGEGAAGKTSLIKRIRKETFNPKESQTHGIRIRKTPFEIGGDTIHTHIWDFGGQEVMHATHQFFLSRRCIYVLVLNSRSDEKAEYWLKHATSFGADSPVLVVLNKIDENPGYDVNRKQLLEKYPQIAGFYRLSCKNDEGIADFEKALQEQVARSDTRRTPFPKAWLAVKQHFSDMQADYIESEVFRQVCAENGVDKIFSQDVLLQFLHDLGVVINFRNLKNFDTQILNPLWLTNGVYRIINSPIVAGQKGLMHERDFDAVINDPHFNTTNTQEKPFRYPKNKLEYIVRVMQEFELCFPLENHSYVVPQLLPVDEPEFRFEGTVLHFVLRFPDFLPDSVFPRLMVKLNRFIDGDLRWRTGMVLHKPSVFNARARVRADREDKEIRIDLCGEEPRRFLSFIRETVREIAADFTKLDYDEMVPIPGAKKEFKRYSMLVAMEKAGKKDVFSEELEKDVSLASLLDGVEEPVMRDEIEQLPVQAFVSYSHKDLDYLEELRAALAPLIRLNKLKIWDDRDINAGEQWEKEIFRELEAADIVLCLVSSDFVASDFCWKKEFEAALKGHHKGTKTVIPIRLRQCDWDDLPIAKLQAAPSSNWINQSNDRDAAWTEVSKQLRPAMDKAKQRKKKLLEKQRKLR